MKPKRSYSRFDTAWRIDEICGPEVALRYLEMTEEADRTSPGQAEPETPPRAKPTRSVVINRVRLNDEELRTLEAVTGVAVRDGNYWYDAICGAWGLEGGPCAGFVRAGLRIGGPLRPDASRGATGVFVNGRELHVMDVVALQRYGPVYRGRYWVDAQGNFGLERGPALGNLGGAQQSASSGPWTAESRFGTAGGDGAGFLFFNDGKTFWSN
jgi:hypothetical protein